MNAATMTSNEPACADHSESDADCTPCYLRWEHARNQTDPKASGHVTYPIRRCPDCATPTATEGGIVNAPARTLTEIRSDLMKLEREMAHHFMYAKWQKDQDRAEEIAGASNDMHHAACKMSVFVYPVWPR